MNLTNAPTYVLEEVTPARMEFVNNLILEDVDRGEVRDNRRELHYFRCVDCQRFATAIDRDVGFTQAVIACPWCLMPSGPTRRQRRPLKGEETIHIEFYRPLDETEVDEFIISAKTKARIIVRGVGGDPSNTESDLYLKACDAEATRLLNGLLMYRDLVNERGEHMK